MKTETFSLACRAVLVAVATACSGPLGSGAAHEEASPAVDPTESPHEPRGTLADAIVEGRPEDLARFLTADPGAARQLIDTEHARLRNSGLGEAPLSIAVRNDRLEAARLLLERGAGEDVDRLRSLLPQVASPAMIDLLAEHGVDLVFASQESASIAGALDSRPRHRAIGKALIRHGVPCSTEDAVRLGIPELIGVDPSGDAEALPTSLLFLAIDAGSSKVLETLLEQGCEVDGAPPPAPYTNWSYPGSPVQYALFRAHVDDALRLIEAGATVDPALRGWDRIPGLREVSWQQMETEEGDLLDRAIDLGSATLFEALVNRGLDPARRSPQSAASTPVLQDRLIRAAWRGQAEIVEQLLGHADDAPEGVDWEGLQLAAASAGHEELWSSLAQRSGVTAPHALAVLGKVEALEDWLRAHPADLERVDPRCRASVLDWAALARRTATVERLVELGARADSLLDWGFLSASLEGAPGTTMPRLEHWADSTWIVHRAVVDGHLDVARPLLRAGARLGGIALWQLITQPGREATELLADSLRLGYVDSSDEAWGEPSLCELAPTLSSDAESRRRWELLVAAGAADRMRGAAHSERLDALHRCGAPAQVLRELREGGAPVSASVAITCGSLDGAALRRAVDGMSNEAWSAAAWVAARHGRVQEYAALLRARERRTTEEVFDLVHSVSYIGRIDLLEIAADRAPPTYNFVEDAEVFENGDEHKGFIEELIRRGADPYQMSGSGRGPLHRAVAGGRLVEVEELLEGGEDVDLRSKRGRTPLREVPLPWSHSWRQEFDELNALDVLSSLLEAGADPLSVDDGGRVAFEQLLRADWSEEVRVRVIEALGRQMDPAWL